MGLQGHAVGQVQAGQLIRARLQVEADAAALGDRHRVVQRLGQLRPEKGVHLLRRPQVEVVDAEPEGIVGVVGPGVDAQQNLMPFEVLRAQVVRVARRDQWNARIPGDAHQGLVDQGLLGERVRHDLQEEVALAHDVSVQKGPFGRLRLLAGENELRNLPGEAGRRGDQPPGMTRQQVVVDPRLVVEPVGIGDRDQLDEVAIALVVLGEEDQVVVLPLLLPGTVAVGIDVGLAAQDGLHPAGPAVLVELHRPVHGPVIRHGDGGSPPLRDPACEVPGADGPVQKAVLGMHVQMNERPRHALIIPSIHYHH